MVDAFSSENTRKRYKRHIKRQVNNEKHTGDVFKF